MKTDIQPKYDHVVFRCTSCNNEFLGKSTRLNGTQIKFEGKSYPEVTIEICYNCHNFYTGKKSNIIKTGRVEQFNKKFGNVVPTELKKKAKK